MNDYPCWFPLLGQISDIPLLRLYPWMDGSDPLREWFSTNDPAKMILNDALNYFGTFMHVLMRILDIWYPSVDIAFDLEGQIPVHEKFKSWLRSLSRKPS